MGDALHDGLHELNGFQSCICEERVDVDHLRNEVVDRVVEIRLIYNCLVIGRSDYVTSEAQWPDLGNRREDSPRCLHVRMNLDIG